MLICRRLCIEIALAGKANQFALRRVAKRQRAHHQEARSMIDGGHIANAPLPTLRIRILNLRTV
jgi:hypothetical protein